MSRICWDGGKYEPDRLGWEAGKYKPVRFCLLGGEWGGGNEHEPTKLAFLSIYWHFFAFCLLIIGLNWLSNTMEFLLFILFSVN